MSRLRRLLRQLVQPSSHYDVLTDAYLIPVSGQMLDALGEWSQPVQVKVEETAAGFQLIVRAAR